MKNRGLVFAAVAAALLTGTAAVLLVGETPADGSALSRGSRGWLAARRYLEERHCHVALLDRGLDTTPTKGVLVLAFPWQDFGWDDVSLAIDRHLQSGGSVVFAYAGSFFDGSESAVAGSLGLTLEDRHGPPPLNPRKWREYATEEWSLIPDPSLGDGLRPIRISATRRAPLPPEGATVLARDGKGRTAAFQFRRWQGQVVVVPAEAFANARLGQPGNADLLEALHHDLGPSWLFDEFHHGLRQPLTPSETGPQRVLLLYVVQMAFLYVLTVLAVARRFGPAWTEPIVTSGSAATFLVGLGALHHRLGHHGEAAPLVLARARELNARLQIPDADPGDAGGLLALARRVGQAQAGRGRKT